jgi:hypothetical protein
MQRIRPFAQTAFALEPRDLVSQALAILADETNKQGGAASLNLDRPPSPETDAPSLPVSLWLQRRVLSDGSDVMLPIRYFDAQCLLATFAIEPIPATVLLAAAGLRPALQEDGKALAVLGCFEYRTTDIGSYNEVCVSILALAPQDPTPALYVTDLPVTTPAANMAGREIWGFNKFVTPIEVQRDRKDFSTTVYDPGANTIMTLAGTRDASVDMPAADVLTFSILAGKLLKTIVRVMTPWNLSGGGNFQLRIGKSAHPMADNLRRLGLDGAGPILLQYANPFQSLLFPGRSPS